VKRGLKIAGITALVLFLLMSLASPWMLQCLYFLAAGWAHYLVDDLPKVTVKPEGVLSLAGLLVMAAAVGHGFCRWMWQSTGHDQPWRARWTMSGLSVVVLMFAAGMAVTGMAHQTGWLLRSPVPLTRSSWAASSERNASASLKTIATAQADFRSNDRDNNHENDYWRDDIAGLFTIVPDGSSGPEHAIKLIERSIACADDRPVKPADAFSQRMPKAGYWYRALKFHGETVPDRQRFAACAFPEDSSRGKWIFIISDKVTMYRKAVSAEPPPQIYPDDPEKEGWERMD